MELSPAEQKQLKAEWARANKFGARRSRQRALASLVSTGVAVMLLIPVLVFFGGSGILFVGGLSGAIAIGAGVRAALLPRGQFG